MAEPQTNHVSRKISGRNVTTSSVDTTVADYGRYQNSGRQQFSQRPQQPLNTVYNRTNSMEFVKACPSRLSTSRPYANQGDGRWNDRYGVGMVNDLGRLSLRNPQRNPQHHLPLENCFEQLKLMEKFRYEVSTSL